MNKEVQGLVKHLRDQGLTVSPSGGGHLKVYDNGATVYTLPSTPGGSRWLQNTISELKRMGLWSRAKTKKSAGGMSPPPVFGENTMKEDVVVATGTPVGAAQIKRASALMDQIRSHYELRTRRGRTVGHGAVPILGQVIGAFEKETGLALTTPDYKGKDKDDRQLMANMAASRVGKVVTMDPSEKVGRATEEALDYAELSWGWFKDLGYVFPDGRVMYLNARGIEVEYPAVVAEPPMPEAAEVPAFDPKQMVADLADASDALDMAIQAVEERVDNPQVPTPGFSENGTPGDPVWDENRLILALDVAVGLGGNPTITREQAVLLALRVANS